MKARGLTIEWKLPIAVGSLLLLTVSVALVAAYREVERISRQAAAARLEAVTRELAGLLQRQVPIAVGPVRSIAGHKDVVSYLASRDPSSRDRALKALKSSQTDRTRTAAIELWDAQGTTVLAGEAQPPTIARSVVAELTAAADLSNSGTVGGFHEYGKAIVYPLIAPVTDGDARLGYVLHWRRMTVDERDSVQALIGPDIALLLGTAGALRSGSLRLRRRR